MAPSPWLSDDAERFLSPCPSSLLLGHPCKFAGLFAAWVLIGTGALFALLWMSELIPATVTGQAPPSRQGLGGGDARSGHVRAVPGASRARSGLLPMPELFRFTRRGTDRVFTAFLTAVNTAHPEEVDGVKDSERV